MDRWAEGLDHRDLAAEGKGGAGDLAADEATADNDFEAGQWPGSVLPDAEGNAPVPGWKRIDLFQPALSARDQARAAAAGTITGEQYGDLERAGEA